MWGILWACLNHQLAPQAHKMPPPPPCGCQLLLSAFECVGFVCQSVNHRSKAAHRRMGGLPWINRVIALGVDPTTLPPPSARCVLRYEGECVPRVCKQLNNKAV